KTLAREQQRIRGGELESVFETHELCSVPSVDCKLTSSDAHNSSRAYRCTCLLKSATGVADTGVRALIGPCPFRAGDAMPCRTVRSRLALLFAALLLLAPAPGRTASAAGPAHPPPHPPPAFAFPSTP